MNETLQLLGMALGLGALAGLNLYLTVFVTGLAINQHWIVLAERYESLQVLGHPAIIVTAGVLYFLEFFADKIPWVDSLWDSLHTVIRPLGAAFIAIQVLGETNEVFEIVISLLAGGTALVTHSVKASTRLLVNASPEPFSNIALSVAEDATVLGGLALIHFNPIIALLVLLASLGTVFYYFPRILRSVRARTWLVWRKLKAPANAGKTIGLSSKLPAEYDMGFSHHTLMQGKVAWGVPCITGPGKGLPPNQFGYLVVSNEEPKKIFFIAKRSMSRNSRSIEIAGFKVSHEPRFLSEDVLVYRPESREKYTFLFDRSQSGLAELVAEALEARLTAPDPSASAIVAPGSEKKDPELLGESANTNHEEESSKLHAVKD